MARIGLLQALGDEGIDAEELGTHRHREALADVMDEGIFPQQRVHLQLGRAFAVQHLDERRAERDRNPGILDAAQIERAAARVNRAGDRRQAAQQREEELGRDRVAHVARRLAGALVGIVQDRQEFECAVAKEAPVRLAELEIAAAVDADQQHVDIGRMKSDEIADIGLEPADLAAARIERMQQADAGAPHPVLGGNRSGHAAGLRAEMICGMARATRRGMAAMQRA